jgi:hypothetical protein
MSPSPFSSLVARLKQLQNLRNRHHGLGLSREFDESDVVLEAVSQPTIDECLSHLFQDFETSEAVGRAVLPLWTDQNLENFMAGSRPEGNLVLAENGFGSSCPVQRDNIR